MKQIASFLATALLCAVVVQAQEPPRGHRVGLIDMGHVFKNYKKFEALAADLRAQGEDLESQAKPKVDRLRQLQQQLASGNIEEGSPDFTRLENEMVALQTELQSEGRMLQRDFMRKEAQIYKTIYLEVETAVRQYADYYGYTLILRFQRNSVDSADDPQAIISGMNRQVIFHRATDDLTDPILQYLNDQWAQRQAAGPSGQPTR